MAIRGRMARRWPCDAVARRVTCEMEHGPSIIICILSPIVDVGTINGTSANGGRPWCCCTHRCGSGASGARCVHVHGSPFCTDDWPIVSTGGTIEIIASHSRVLVEISGRSFRLIIAPPLYSIRLIALSLSSSRQFHLYTHIYIYIFQNKIIIYFDSTLRNREGVRFEMLEGLNREKRRLSRKGDNG